jgi:ketosteroid isomerase-like protein
MGQTGQKDTARGWLEAVGSGDTERLLSLMTPDGRVHTVGTSVLSADRGLDALVELVSQLKQFTVDGLHFQFSHFTEEDDRVAVEFTGSAELVNGTRYDNTYHLLFHFRDGKVARVKEYLDTQLVNDTVGPLILQAAQPPSRPGPGISMNSLRYGKANR